MQSYHSTYPKSVYFVESSFLCEKCKNLVEGEVLCPALSWSASDVY